MIFITVYFSSEKDIDIKKAISHLDKGKQAVMSQTKLQYSGNKININKSDNTFYPLI